MTWRIRCPHCGSFKVEPKEAIEVVEGLVLLKGTHECSDCQATLRVTPPESWLESRRQEVAS